MELAFAVAILALAALGLTVSVRQIGRADPTRIIHDWLHTDIPTQSTPAHWTPNRSHDDDGGADVRNSVPVALDPGERALVGTSVHVNIPPGFVGLVCPRSGLAHKKGLTVLNSPGVVDAGYVGEVKVNLINHGHERVTLFKGERIAQLVILPVHLGDYIHADRFDVTQRGINGHGSTGSN